MKDIVVRSTTCEDTPQILEFIRDLAAYEKLVDEVVADEAILQKTLFGENPHAFVIFAEIKGEVAGFALYFYNYSTFLGRPGIYLEDLYIKPEHRGLGAGKKLLTYLAKKAADEGCGRMEWWVLDWNHPSIEFYKSLGAKPMQDWTVYRLEGKDLIKAAALHI